MPPPPLILQQRQPQEIPRHKMWPARFRSATCPSHTRRGPTRRCWRWVGPFHDSMSHHTHTHTHIHQKRCIHHNMNVHLNLQTPQHLDLEVRQGETLALVGPSGSGRCVHLITGRRVTIQTIQAFSPSLYPTPPLITPPHPEKRQVLRRRAPCAYVRTGRGPNPDWAAAGALGLGAQADAAQGRVVRDAGG